MSKAFKTSQKILRIILAFALIFTSCFAAYADEAHIHIYTDFVFGERVDPTCSEEGYYYITKTCSECHETVTVKETIPATGVHVPGAEVIENVVEATATAPASYDSVRYCVYCHKELSRVRKIDGGEDFSKKINTEVKMDNSVVDNLNALAYARPEDAQAVVSSVNDTVDYLQKQMNEGKMSADDYANSIKVVEAITEAAVTVGAQKDGAVEETKKLSDSLAIGSGLNMTGLVGDFYQKQFNAILNKDTGLVTRTANDAAAGTLDLSIPEETYRNAVDFVDDSVNKMTDAAKFLRTCSGAKMVSTIELYISEISSRTFQDFDKEAADEEFVQAAYEAILANMQSQVRTALVTAYEEQKDSYVGTAKSQMEEEVNRQLAAVDDIETFEIMVLEVMRQKYVSILNNQLEDEAITQEAYDLAWSKAVDVEAFEPVYHEIFRSWALNQESSYGITLEELTTATIENTTRVVAPIQVSGSISKAELITLICFGGSILAIIGCGLVVKFRKEEVVNG